MQISSLKQVHAWWGQPQRPWLAQNWNGAPAQDLNIAGSCCLGGGVLRISIVVGM